MFSFIKSMMWFIKKNWYFYVAIVVVGILISLSNLLPATIVSSLTGAIDKNTVTTSFIIKDILISYILIMFLIYIVSTTKRVLQNRLKVRLYYALQVRYMENILVQDATFFEHFQAGDLLTRALGDVKSVNFSGSTRLLNIFLEFITIVVTFVAMLFINVPLTLFSIIPLPIIFFFNFYLKKKVKRNWKEVREEASKMGNVILESITNVRTIRAFSKEEENYEKNLVYSNNVYKIERRNLKLNVLFQPVFNSITAISTIIAYGLGSYYILKNGSIEINDFVQFTIYLTMFSGPLTNIGNLLNNFYQSLISADRINEVYNAKSSVIDNEDARNIKHIDNIEFRNFSFKYEDDNFYVLKNINLTIKKGETLGIVGRTGSGKSTLVRQLVRQLPICKGELFINGKFIEDFNQESVRSMVSYVPQEHVLFSRSVYQNVALGRADASSDEEIRHAIELADFAKDINALPYGLDTIVGEYGVTLSGGQKQRLAIARAFLKNSDILILDDSLSAVDGTTEANIIKSLKEYRRNKTNIIVAHRLSAVMGADHIIVLDDGVIVEEGTHEELMANKGWYYHQYLSQQMEEGGLDEK